MNRRAYLTAIGASTAALAGCTGGLLGGGGGAGDDPAATVEAFVQALDDGDVERANELIHSESPQGELSESGASAAAEAEITVEETEVLEQSEDEARVRVEITFEQDGQTENSETVYVLRTEDGAWRIWDQAPAGGGQTAGGQTAGDQAAAPQVAWSFTDLASENAVEITHDGGDAVVAANVTVRVDGENAGSLTDYFEVSEITAGDTGTVGVPADTTGELLLVWSNPDADQTQVIASHSYDVG
jgi:hypothetical protein